MKENTTRAAVDIVEAIHEWVLGLAGSRFDPDAVSAADRAAINALREGVSADEAIEIGRSTYSSLRHDSALRVALVDDEADVRVLLRMSLSDDSFQVVGEAANGKEALRLIEEQRPDIVVLDLNMPVMSGLEALKEINERWPDTKVVVHTAFGDVFKPKLAGVKMEAFVDKSGQLDDVLARLKTA